MFVALLQVVDIVSKFYHKKDEKGAISYLVKEATQRWLDVKFYLNLG